MLITGSENKGRSHARNRLIAHAKTDWILFLDADMLPDGRDFLDRYTSTIAEHPKPAVISGGFSLKQVRPNTAQALHAAQSLNRNVFLQSKDPKNQACTFLHPIFSFIEPYFPPSVSTMDLVAGDGKTSTGAYAWLKRSQSFISTTLRPISVSTTPTLYLPNTENPELTLRGWSPRHPEATRKMNLAQAARKLARLPGRSRVAYAARWIARSSLPNSLRLKALKLYRAATYAEHLK